MKILAKLVSWSVGLVAFLLLIAHTFEWRQINVDVVTILLLTVIALFPLIELIRKVKIGEFEAEIAPREVAAAGAKLSREAISGVAPTSPETAFVPELVELVQVDAQLGLAKLRMELERILKALHSHTISDERQTRVLSLGKIVRDLTESEVIPKEISSGLGDVISLANRAVHGEYIRARDAEELAKVGLRLLAKLRDIYRERIVKPVESIVISDDERDKYFHARYRVTTVVPLVEEPYMNTYILDQADLDDFLEGYEEYAEFIVSVERIEDELKNGM